MVNMSKKQLKSLVKKNKQSKLKKKADKERKGNKNNNSSHHIRDVSNKTTSKSIPNDDLSVATSSAVQEKKSTLSALQQQFKDKLDGARFRSLNEKLYTRKSEDAFHEFQEDPSLFKVYHEGYKKQVESWPENPLDNIITWVKSKSSSLIIADMGCGDARLQSSISNKVYSFDLVSVNPFVIACDMSNVPLPDSSVDIVIFCLSLMGTNISDFLKEAHRILKPTGFLKIAEVKSRFFESGKDGIKVFTRTIKKAGFNIYERILPNKMFFVLSCKKTDRESTFDETFSAKPCVYKKR